MTFLRRAAEVQRACEAWLARADRRPAVWLAVVALLLASQISALWYPSPDGAAYLSIARSIARGGPVARLGAAELGYPIGYPLLISPAFLAGPRPYVVLSALHWLLAVAFLLGVYRWMRRRVESGALWLTALVMANVSVGMTYRRTLSEAAFLTMMIWTVNLLDGLGAIERREHGKMPLRAFTLAMAGVLMLVGLTAMREIGILFGAGFGLILVTQLASGATPRPAGATALALTAAALLLALVSIRPERLAAAGPALAGHLAGYADASTAMTGALDQRVFVRMSEIGQLLVPGMFKTHGSGWLDVNTLVYAPLFLVVAVGWWHLLRRRADVFVATAPLYVAALLFWPYRSGTRYVLPLLPLLVACLWMHIEPYRRWRLTLVAAALLAHTGVALGYWLARDRPEALACDGQQPAIAAITARVRQDPGAVATADLRPCLTLMLALELDRPVQAVDGAAENLGTAEWLVTVSTHSSPSAFVPAGEFGPYVLWRRS